MIMKVVGLALVIVACAVGFFDMSVPFIGQIPIPFTDTLATWSGYTMTWWREKLSALIMGIIGWLLLRR